MPKALAIETSCRTGSIAIVDGEDARVLAEEQFQHGLQNAAQILPIIDRLVRSAGWSPRDLEQVYVSAGPGSFTGLRIGITLAKTLALASGVKLIAVPSVRVLVENAPADAKHVVIVLDAKRDQIFTARFERRLSPSPGNVEKGPGAGWLEREPAQLGSLMQLIANSPRPVYLLGEGIPFHEKFIPRQDASVMVTPPESWRPRASVVAKLGAAMAQSGQFTDPDHLLPIYIRRPEAEEKLDAARAAEGRRG